MVKLRLVALATVFLFVVGGPAMAEFPDRPIRLLVGFPPGGSADVVARAIQPIVGKRVGQSLIIENRAGVGGVIAVDVVWKAAPDGAMIALAGAVALAAEAERGQSAQCRRGTRSDRNAG